ncbi:MAG: hypothetical protein WCK33_12365 [Phycisphaerae bacterium]
MRLLTRQLHRAFPELDPFDDGRCGRFVAQAARSTSGRLASIVAVLTAIILGVVGPPAAMTWLRSTSLASHFTWSPLWLDASLVAGFVLGPFAGIVTRDVALSLRVRRVLRARGRCYGCGYSLLGIPIGANLEVICPECRTACTVDAAMAALTDDATGFLPPTAAQWRSTAQGTRRSIRRIAGRGALIMLAVAPLLGGIYEGFLRWQASRAAALATSTLSELDAWITALGPKEGIDGWQELLRLSRRRAELDTTLAESALVGPDGVRVVPDYFLALSSPTGTVMNRQGLDITATRDEAFRRLRAYEAEKLFDAYDALGTSPLLAVPQPAVADTPSAWQYRRLPGEDLDGHHVLLAVRLQQCATDGDMAAMARTLRTMLAIGRMSRMQATTIDHLKGARIEIQACRGIRRALAFNATAIDAATIDMLANVIDSMEFKPPADYPWQGYRLAGRASVAWFFSNPSWVRFDLLGAGARDLGGGVLGRQWVGTLWGTLEELDARHAAMQIWDGTPRWSRSGQDPSLVLPRHVAAAAFRLRGFGASEIMALAELDRRGLRIQLEIERAIRTRGEPPESTKSLESLLAERGLTLATDPCSTLPTPVLQYRKLTPERAASRPELRGYLLYSVGPDGKDDDGHTPPAPYSKSGLWRSSSFGQDYVLNDPG